MLDIATEFRQHCVVVIADKETMFQNGSTFLVCQSWLREQVFL